MFIHEKLYAHHKRFNHLAQINVESYKENADTGVLDSVKAKLKQLKYCKYQVWPNSGVLVLIPVWG